MKRLGWSFILYLMIGQAVGQDFEVVGSITQPIHIKSNPRRFAASPLKEVTLLNIALSAKAQQIVHDQAIKALSEAPTFSIEDNKLPKKLDLGMNHVPVLDQGYYGTCVVFANTAAVDAAIGRGDYVSQLCLLQLGRYLAANAYIPSGWDGSIGSLVLQQLNTFGIVNKQQQKQYGCGGITEYPISKKEEPAGEMSISDYHHLSESLGDYRVDWSPIVDVYQLFRKEVTADTVLIDVKKSLMASERVTFGILLPLSEEGLAGAVGKYKQAYDTWVLTPNIAQDAGSGPSTVGHEMIITGYNDEAVAIDDEGHAHHGLLTLRNSWGEGFGDHGNFYMSYDYFRGLVVEAQRIRLIPAVEEEN